MPQELPWESSSYSGSLFNPRVDMSRTPNPERSDQSAASCSPGLICRCRHQPRRRLRPERPSARPRTANVLGSGTATKLPPSWCVNDDDHDVRRGAHGDRRSSSDRGGIGRRSIARDDNSGPDGNGLRSNSVRHTSRRPLRSRRAARCSSHTRATIIIDRNDTGRQRHPCRRENDERNAFGVFMMALGYYVHQGTRDTNSSQ